MIRDSRSVMVVAKIKTYISWHWPRTQRCVDLGESMVVTLAKWLGEMVEDD